MKEGGREDGGVEGRDRLGSNPCIACVILIAYTAC